MQCLDLILFLQFHDLRSGNRQPPNQAFVEFADDGQFVQHSERDVGNGSVVLHQVPDREGVTSRVGRGGGTRLTVEYSLPLMQSLVAGNGSGDFVVGEEGIIDGNEQEEAFEVAVHVKEDSSSSSDDTKSKVLALEK